MGGSGEELNIARNVRTIEWLKAELVENTSLLLKAMLKSSEDRMLEALAGMMISAYLMARRLGFAFEDLDRCMDDRLQMNIRSDHEIERWYGDLSSLKEYLLRQKR